MHQSDSSISFRTGLRLLDNAFNFVESATSVLKQFEEGGFEYDDNDLKSAVLSVTTGVELILKAKIVEKDWRQLFQFPNKSERSKLLSGDFYSVKLEDCMSRIEQLHSVQIAPHHKSKLDNIRQIRNKLVHFHYDFDRQSFIALIATCIDIFIEFYKSFIIDFFEDYDRSTKIDDMLKRVKGYVEIRLQSIYEKLKSSTRPLTYHLNYCNNCEQDTYIIKDNKEISCLFCGETYKIEDVAKDSSENGLTKECPKCHLQSLFLTHNSDDSWECLICGYYNNIPTQFRLRDGRTTSDSKRLDL